MRLSRQVGWWLVACGGVCLLTAGSGASEFAERLAAWNVGPSRANTADQGVLQASYAEPSPSDAGANSVRSVPSQATARSQWEQMAFGAGEGGCGAGGCGDMGSTGCDMCCGKPLWWAKFDVLLWWRQGRDLPPLATSDPISEDSSTAGVLPDATILFGGGREVSQMQVGGRIDLGFWMDPSECWGVGNRFFGLGRDSTHFQIDSLDNPVLGVPFFNAGNDANDALLVAFPGLSSGQIDVRGTSEVLGNDVYARFLVCRDCDSRLDFVTGYHFSRINDDLRVRSSLSVTDTGGNIPIGTQTSVFDRFDTRNEFHGGILGLMHEYRCRCWSLQTLGRISIGNMHEEVIIDGQTSIAVPGQDPQVTEGGLFTGDNNLGRFSRNEFTAVTEIGLNWNYHWGPCTKLTVGYSFIYWNDVLRPGDQIDPRVGQSSTTGTDHPQFRFDHGDYWVQGINLGIVRDF